VEVKEELGGEDWLLIKGLMTETVYVVTFGCDPPPFIFIRLYIVFP
jgi:hypothetical protein